MTLRAQEPRRLDIVAQLELRHAEAGEVDARLDGDDVRRLEGARGGRPHDGQLVHLESHPMAQPVQDFEATFL